MEETRQGLYVAVSLRDADNRNVSPESFTLVVLFAKQQIPNDSKLDDPLFEANTALNFGHCFDALLIANPNPESWAITTKGDITSYVETINLGFCCVFIDHQG